MWIKNHHIFKALNSLLSDSATPKNPPWRRNSGLTSGIFTVVQILSGLVSALYYRDYVNYAPISAEHLIDEINNGHAFRFAHSSGARILFLPTSTHIGRRIWYKSLTMFEVWITGVAIFTASTIVSLLGYVLPRGQMPFWAATATTNLPYVVPHLGGVSLEVVRGGSRVGGPTLSRSPTLHYIIPSLILPTRVIHLVFLHPGGRSNPAGVPTGNEKTEPHRHPTLKDSHLILIALLIPNGIPFLFPSLPIDSENPPVVDSIKTPEHTKPERYFLFAYCISRRVPNKVGGALGLIMRIMVLLPIPPLISAHTKFADPINVTIKVSLFPSFIMSTWLGGCSVEWPPSNLGMLVSVTHLLITIQLINPFWK